MINTCSLDLTVIAYINPSGSLGVREQFGIEVLYKNQGNDIFMIYG